MQSQRPALASVIRQQGLGALSQVARIDAMRATVWRALGDFFRDPRLVQLFGRRHVLRVVAVARARDAQRRGPRRARGRVDRRRRHARARSLCLAKLAERRGTTVRCEAPVREVTVRGGRATGVILASGEHLAADAVVMNADTAALSDGRFGDARAAWPRNPSEGRSLSAVTYAMATRAQGFELVRHNVFFSSDYAREFEDIFDRDELPRSPRSTCAPRIATTRPAPR